ncbi:predicted protein, partial [Nematostella vectensis]
IGMRSGNINSSRITASSSLGADYQPHYGRLGTYLGNGAWCALNQDVRQYLQVDLEVPYRIMGFSTQGKHRMSDDTIGHAWVTSYNVAISSHGYIWKHIHNSNNTTLVRSIFEGNTESFSVVKHIFANPFRAKYFKVNIKGTFGSLAFRMEIYGCRGATAEIGMRSGNINSSRITASSSLGADYQPHYGRLGTYLGNGAWCALNQDDRQYLQVDLEVPYRIMGFSTQGKHRMSDDTIGHAWVTSYNVAISSHGYIWKHIHNIHNSNNTILVFAGNTISNLTVKHLLASPVVGRLVRFLPTTWHNRICMRVEICGCKGEQTIAFHI